MPEPSVYRDGAAELCPARFNIAAHAVRDPARSWPESEALIVVDGAAPGELREVWTFARIDAAVRRAAGAILAAGIRPGDRVLIRVGDGPRFPVAFFGAIAAGAIAMPLSSLLSARELAYIARDAQPALALLAEDTPAFSLEARRLDPLALHDAAPVDYADTGAEEPAFLVYTSGSTGEPKGVLHAQRSAWARRMMRAGWHDLRAGDRIMHAGAFNWTYTLGVGLSDPWSVGATAILNAGDHSPELWAPLAKAFRPTQFAAVPGVYRRLLKYGADLRDSFASLRHALTAGEKLHPAIHAEWSARTGKPLLESLGMSEISTYISSAPARQAGQGFAGWPQPGRHVAVLGEDGAPLPRGEEGALGVHRGDPGLMLGYWNRPEETHAAMRGEWFLTGDRALMRADGAIAYCGRQDDLMNAQGYRVSPLEVEEALLAHPAVADAGVTEQTVGDGLSIVAAWIVPQGEARRDALEVHCRATLATYKRPRAYFRVDNLPRGANGKLRRRDLLRMDCESLE